MRNNVKAYKVCTYANGRYYSAMKIGPYIQYRQGVLNYPTKQPHANPFLFVFSTLEQAQAFCSPARNHVIFEVRAHGVSKTKKDRWGHMTNVENYPWGTLFCSSMRLVKKL